MTRLLFWLALAILVVMAIRTKLRQAAPPPQAPRSPEPARPVAGQSEPMVNCAHCGVYFPASEAVRAGGREYCCPAHARHSAS
ncbi:PP0621 family protein [Massilia agilis]|uniref:PP0621 family protein n=1 Tax=Massilia agilis TaxID=1811226 RepID=A0ABT2DEL2_9BURK|nr:PP0621 family protein [Massilia agilis]MCS0809765.1 PP0621 family protein [Massilia agilis]